MSTHTDTVGRQQWQQVAWITLGAIVVYLGFRILPTGTNLSHMDFRVDPKAGNAIEFCDPLNPQFIPVIAARSPVTVALKTEGMATVGSEAKATITLRTSNGKAVAPEDLLVTHTRPLHLLIVDPSLTDYQHVHPQPGKEKGDWTFTFTPHTSGTYRVFADFTPAATARGLYASADLEVAGGGANAGVGAAKAKPYAQPEGYRFALETAQKPAKAGEPLDLRFTISKNDGGSVPMELVMGAYAHLVAFDGARTGFAHLHPVEPETTAPDTKKPTLNFKLTIPNAGKYVVWAQVNLGGAETFVPFELAVE